MKTGPSERPYGRRRNLANCLRKEPRSGPALKESPLPMLGSSHTCSLVGIWTLAEGRGPRPRSHTPHELRPGCRPQSGINHYPGLGKGSHLVSVP